MGCGAVKSALTKTLAAATLTAGDDTYSLASLPADRAGGATTTTKAPILGLPRHLRHSSRPSSADKVLQSSRQITASRLNSSAVALDELELDGVEASALDPRARMGLCCSSSVTGGPSSPLACLLEAIRPACENVLACQPFLGDRADVADTVVKHNAAISAAQILDQLMELAPEAMKGVKVATATYDLANGEIDVFDFVGNIRSIAPGKDTNYLDRILQSDTVELHVAVPPPVMSPAK